MTGSRSYPRIVVLTGAGISAESGVPTFRDADGLWEGHDVVEVASPEGYAADPVLVQTFYDARRRALELVEPNPAHEALARLERALGDNFLLVTQNIDDLHERAGSTRVLHMHGELRSALCANCETRMPWLGDLGAAAEVPAPKCPVCDRSALRPDVVWFGEVPYDMPRIVAALETVDLFVSIGTSGAVYPAAGFVQYAADKYADTLELNLEPSAGTDLFAAARHGPASRLVPAWVEEILEPLR